jgi:predicted nucleic acid-binding protein
LGPSKPAGVSDAYLALAEALDAPLLTSDAGMRSVPNVRTIVEIL